MNAKITLRPPTAADITILESWDREPHVIACTTDDQEATIAFSEDHDWRQELSSQSEVFYYLIAEIAGRPIGAMLIIDPALEPSHYWGDTERDQRAIDIWIGKSSDHGKGYGEIMMGLAMERCFDERSVTAIIIDPLSSNTRAHKFYQRIGFKIVGQRFFGDDDCLVHKITRADWENSPLAKKIRHY